MLIFWKIRDSSTSFTSIIPKRVVRTQGHIHHRAEAPELHGEFVHREWKGQVLSLQGFLLGQGRVCMPEQHLVEMMCSNCYILVPLPDLVTGGDDRIPVKKNLV